jgi:hypothetical protein
MAPILRKWHVYRIRFEELEKLLDSCSKQGHTLYEVFSSTALRGYYEVIVYQEPDVPVAKTT